MTRFLKCALPSLSALSLLAGTALAQSLPADTGVPPSPGVGFSLPRIGGSLNYSLTGSELISNGFYNDSGVEYTTNFSGDLAYLSKSEFHPFSAVYSGGVLLANSGQPTTFYQSLSFSQVLSTKNWNIVVGDSISYLPESPSVGLSGVPGVGDLGVDPVTTAIGANPGLGILTTYGPRVSNTTTGTVSRNITGRISAQAGGYFSIQRFIGDNASEGVNSTGKGGSAGLTYKISARDALSASYNYTLFSFSGSPGSYTAQGATVSYSRNWSPRLSTNVYVGPQISSANAGPAFDGTYVSVAAGASASYLSGVTSYSLSYSHGVNNGSGVIAGALSDSASIAAHRRFGRDWVISGDVSYSRTSSLPIFDLYGFNSDAVAFGAQGGRAFGRYFSGFVSYTVQDQSVSGTGVGPATPNAFNGVYQVVSLGITYSPRSILLGR